MFVRWLLIALVVLIAVGAFWAGINASAFAHGPHQGLAQLRGFGEMRLGRVDHLVVGVLVTLTGLLSAISVIWNNYPPKRQKID
jgi:hypothetical protein